MHSPEELERYADAKRYDRLQQKIMETYDKWGQQQRTQLWMENASRRILNFVGTQHGYEGSLLESEYHLEDAFYYATSTQMLHDNLMNIFYRFQDEQKEKPKVDSEEFFDSIRKYLKEHLDEPLSLQSLSEEFAISQAYMSKLFRKYAQQSYTQYLTALRMERAKQLMKEDGSLYVKDVAEMVGYRDQFYFSRIFRSYTGRSPAEFVREQ